MNTKSMRGCLAGWLLVILWTGWCSAAERPWLVYLHISPMATKQNEVATSLTTELSRQALLLSAREEFGAFTRDAHCGEPLPVDRSAYAGVLELTGAVSIPRKSILAIEFKSNVPGKAQCRVEHQLKATDSGDMLVDVVGFAEQFSRRDAVDALKSWGLPVVKRTDGAPAGADRLGEMCYFAQFQTLQYGHRALLANPEGSEELSNLARAYANIGQLTRSHFDPACRVYAARSLLYSARLRAMRPDDSLSLATHAYAQAMAGMHVPALADLARARSDLPWAKAAALLCGYRGADLAKLADAEPSIRELASYMSFMTIEQEHSHSLLMPAIDRFAQLSPHCFRYLDAACDIPGVGASHALTEMGPPMVLRTLRDELPLLEPTMPQSLRDQFPKAQAASGDAEYLASAGRSLRACDAPIEPSWPLVGNMVEQTNFLHVFRRAYFMAFAWSVPTDDYLNSVEPLYDKHGLAALIRSMADQYRADPQKRTAFCSGINVPVSYPMAYWVALSTTGAEGQGKIVGRTLTDFMTMSEDRNAYDVERSLYPALTLASQEPPGNLEYILQVGESVLRTSPNNPIAASVITRWRPDVAAVHAQRWTAELSGSLRYQRALAQRHIMNGALGPAAEAYERAVSLAADVSTLRQLADCYLKLKDERRFLATVDRALATPDYGLGHAQCQLTLAEFYQKKGDHEKGIAAAEAGADSWAGWAMLPCAQYHELLGNWSRAELWYDRLAERYDAVKDRYYYCLRTGRGNRAAAADAVRAKERSLPGYRGRETMLDFAQMHLAEKEYPQATEAMRAVAKLENEGYVAMLLAISPDPQITPQERIAALRAAATSQAPMSTSRPYLSRMAGEMAGALEQNGPMDVARVERFISEAPERERPSMHYMLGMYQIQHGREKQGIDSLQRAADSEHISKVSVGLAADELRRSKVIPQQKLRGVWQTQAATAPKAAAPTGPAGTP